MNLNIWEHNYKGDFEELLNEFTVANDEMAFSEMLDNIPEQAVGLYFHDNSTTRLSQGYMQTNRIILLPSVISLDGKLLFEQATDVDNYLLLYKKSIDVREHHDTGEKTKVTLKGLKSTKYDRLYYLSVNDNEFEEVQTKMVDDATTVIPVYKNDIERIELLVEKYKVYDK